MLEVGTNGDNLVDQILHADNTKFAKVFLDDGVISKSNTLLVDLSVSTLVDEFTNALEVGVSVGDPWLDNLEHLQSGLGHANEDTIVDLKKTKQLKDLSGLWCDLVDTGKCESVTLTCEVFENLPLDTDNEDKLLLSRNEEGALLLSQAVKADLLALCVTVLLDVLLRTLEDDTALLLLRLWYEC